MISQLEGLHRKEEKACIVDYNSQITATKACLELQVTEYSDHLADDPSKVNIKGYSISSLE